MSSFNKEEMTFGLLKPDAIRRNLVDAIFNRVKSAGFYIYKIKKTNLVKEDIDFIYSHNLNKEFYKVFVNYMMQDEVILFLATFSGNAIGNLNKIVGHFNPQKAEPGTIRGDLAVPNYFFEGCLQNLIHSSFSREKFLLESLYFFPEERDIIMKHKVIGD